MSVVFDYFRSYRLVVLVLVLGVFSCDTTNVTLEKEDQELNQALFDVFMSSQFAAEVVLPKGFELTTYDKSFYKWTYKQKHRVKVTFSDGPDFKGKFFDTQEKQLHLVFCKVESYKSLRETINSMNRVAWGIDNVQDSLLVMGKGFDNHEFEGKWYLNTKTIGGDCRAKVFKGKEADLLCYYLTKENSDEKKEMSTIGDSVLRTIEFFD